MPECNTTLDDMRIGTSEKPIAGPLTFHDLALIIAAASTLLSIITSFYLMFMHAAHYTKPDEQRYVIRILFMVPVYAASSFLQLKYYWHAIYFSVITDCYEAFAIASFFALLCQYMAPDLHQQKQFFRELQPIRGWVLPISWFKKCCGGERGPWRTPKSGLTWFNIIWIGIYHYCFVHVAMTITAVVTQYFGRYCESSNSPAFSHIWVSSIDGTAVTIAMYCVIQFYIQLKDKLAAHSPLLKVAAIKLVIFLSFWQSTAISLATSTLDLVKPNSVLAYPDIKVGIPNLLLCFEMSLFAILHLWAFPWRPYHPNAPTIFYPDPTPDSDKPQRQNVHVPPAGGFLGLRAIWDAMNLWDVTKAFGRGIRWLFVGIRHRHEDPSYRNNGGLDLDADGKPLDTSYPMPPYAGQPGAKSTDHLPIAQQFRRSTYGIAGGHGTAGPGPVSPIAEEGEGLIANAQDNPTGRAPSPFEDDRYREDKPYESDLGYRGAKTYDQPQEYRGAALSPRSRQGYRRQRTGTGSTNSDSYDAPGAADRNAASSVPGQQSYRQQRTGAGSTTDYYGAPGPAEWNAAASQPASRRPRDSTQLQVGEALWGPNPNQARDASR